MGIMPDPEQIFPFINDLIQEKETSITVMRKDLLEREALLAHKIKERNFLSHLFNTLESQPAERMPGLFEKFLEWPEMINFVLVEGLKAYLRHYLPGEDPEKLQVNNPDSESEPKYLDEEGFKSLQHLLTYAQEAETPREYQNLKELVLQTLPRIIIKA